MKQLLCGLFLTALAFGANAQAPTPPGPQQTAATNPNAPVFKFLNGDSHDFGSIKEGPMAEYTFQFKNTGKEPLIIQGANASCGCTTPEFSKDPVNPGKMGKILVRYTTQGRVGPFTKTVFIQSNAMNPPGKERYELTITGTVQAADKPATPPTPAKS